MKKSTEKRAYQLLVKADLAVSKIQKSEKNGNTVSEITKRPI